MEWYYIGHGSSFDDGMAFVEMAINYHKRGNRSDIDALYYHYMSALIHYWTKLEDFLLLESIGKIAEYYNINQTMINRVFNPRQFVESRDRIIKNMPQYKDIHKAHIVELESIRSIKNGDRMELIQLFTNAFLFIADLFCLKEPKPYSLVNNVYPLVNNTGYFTYNSFLYALINDVLLAGIPSQVSIYDTVAGCSSQFYEHDMQHVQDILEREHTEDELIKYGRKKSTNPGTFDENIWS